MKRQHWRFDFYFRPARPWFRHGKLTEDIGLADLMALQRMFHADFAEIGAMDLTFSLFGKGSPYVMCGNPKCGEVFPAKRITARFCLKCRDNPYLIRTLTDKDFAKKNREWVAKSTRERKERLGSSKALLSSKPGKPRR